MGTIRPHLASTVHHPGSDEVQVTFDLEMGERGDLYLTAKTSDGGKQNLVIISTRDGQIAVSLRSIYNPSLRNLLKGHAGRAQSGIGARYAYPIITIDNPHWVNGEPTDIVLLGEDRP